MQIKKIAELAGVSKSTVSRYLNGGYVSEEKKEVIKKIIEETGYKPSSYAITLRTKVTKQIGVVIPKLNSDSIAKMVSGISNVLRKKGYYLILANVENDEADELNYLEIFNENTVDGIILIASVFTQQHQKVMKKINVPLVILSQYHPEYPCVYFDNEGAAKAISEQILKGHQCPAMISSRADDISTGYERRIGFEAALAGQSYVLEYSDFTFEGGYQACKKLISENPMIDAIFCSTDSIAVGALRYLNEIGKKIPEEISIGCVGGTNITTICSPRLSAANLSYYKSGATVASMLLDLIQGKDQHNKTKMSFELDMNESTKK